jgi:large subunit ribosomal protein L32
MAVPKKRTSSTKGGMRRSHDALKTQSLTACPQCGKAKLPHVVCAACGYYKGRKVVEV